MALRSSHPSTAILPGTVAADGVLLAGRSEARRAAATDSCRLGVRAGVCVCVCVETVALNVADSTQYTDNDRSHKQKLWQC